MQSPGDKSEQRTMQLVEKIVFAIGATFASIMFGLVVALMLIGAAEAKSNGGKCVRAANGYICSGE